MFQTLAASLVHSLQSSCVRREIGTSRHKLLLAALVAWLGVGCGEPSRHDDVADGSDAGAGGTGGGGGSGGHAAAGGNCYAATTSDVPECATMEFCLTSTPSIDVDETNCSPGQCSWSFQSNVGDTLAYDNDQGWVFLRFTDGTLGGAQDTSDLLAGFWHVNFFSKFPDASPTGTIYFEERYGPDAFEIFELAEGRLHVKLAFSIHDPYAFVNSQTAICGDTNQCACTFGYEADTSFEVDLPF